MCVCMRMVYLHMCVCVQGVVVLCLMTGSCANGCATHIVSMSLFGPVNMRHMVLLLLGT